MLNNNVIKLLLWLFLASLGFNVHSSSSIGSLSIDGDTLYFSINEMKKDPSPKCVNPATKSLWAVSLHTKNGQAIYAMLLTAVSGDLNVSINSAGDCNDASGVERPKSVALSE
ncbi:MAG: hypothetical protein GY928_05270 [Colwellia sp.]|nr:hypothetical protein [Colwellia sp.]